MTDSEINSQKNPPAFNLPGIVLAIGAVLIVVHVVRTYLIGTQTEYWVLYGFSFIPMAYHVPVSELIVPLARFWSPFTYGLLHGDWTHLLVNLVWLSAFGSAVARRFGSARFLVFMLAGTAAGALAHYVFHPMGLAPVIGASGAVSACMGAAVRFAFTPGRPISEATNAPALSLIQSLANRSIMTFVVLWFVMNWLFGAGVVPLGVEAQIAWEAHMGGFLLGWLGFALFDKKSGDRI
ncbi:MAG: rhomboid family intramembrane serine protease [Rhizobiaceae bacterium]